MSVNWDDLGNRADELAAARALNKSQAKPTKKRKKQKQPEKDLQDAIIEWINYHPMAKAIRMNSGKVQTIHKRWVQMAPKGTADILACYRGKMLWIEVKAPGKLSGETQAQKDTGQDWADVGAYYYCVDSLEAVQSIFDETA